MIRKTRTDAWEAKLSDEDRTKLYTIPRSSSQRAS